MNDVHYANALISILVPSILLKFIKIIFKSPNKKKKHCVKQKKRIPNIIICKIKV